MTRLRLALAIWSTFGLVCLIAEYAHAGEFDHTVQSEHRIKLPSNVPPGLAKVMAEGAGRVVKPTCADVRAMVAMIGEAKAESAARSAGATERQIKDAKRCLQPSSQ